MHGDVINHFHHDNGFTTTCAAEQSHFTTTWERYEEIDNLDACLKNVHLGILLGKEGSRPVDRHFFI